ncbi:hypothetical protein LCGC14_1474420 [marine sediment metagenome]|uniref:DUF935 family protein n=1 Tax=marine sediment metagenome TaxID=412755 RepID=A0A0F9JBC9_9ZZZZ
MGWLTRLFGHTPTTVERAIPAVIAADVWDMLVHDVRGGPKTPTTRDLEAAYTSSDLVFAIIQEIVAAVTDAEINASLRITTLLEHPNAVQDWPAFIEQFLAAWLTTGMGAALKLPLGSAAVQELHVLKTSCLNRQPGSFTDPWRHMGYSDGRNHYPSLDGEDLIYRLRPSAGSATAPASPLLSVWTVVQMDMLLSMYQKRAVERLPYLIGVVENDEPTTKDQRNTLAQSLKQILGDTLVMPKGAHLKTPGVERANSITLPGLGEAAESRVCAVYNVPAELVGLMVGLKRRGYATYGEARASFYAETISPILTQLGEAFSRGLGEEVTFTLPEPEPEPDSPTAQAEKDKETAGIGGSV